MSVKASPLAIELEGKTVLVTGASGYIANRLLDSLGKYDAEIIAVSRKKIPESHRFSSICTDITKYDVWIDLMSKVDIIVHLAGNTSIKAAELDPVESLKSTLIPIANLIRAAKELDRRPKVIFSSTATVYGLTSCVPQNENQQPNPITTYDLHKLFAERQLQFAASRGEIEVVCLRLSNVYGPSGSISSAIDRGVLNKVALAAMRGESLSLFGGGEYFRDYIFVDDVVRAITMVAASKEKLPQLINVSSGTSVTIRNIFQILANFAEQRTGLPVNLQSVEWPASVNQIELRNYMADIGLIKRKLGWLPSVTLEVGLSALLDNS